MATEYLLLDDLKIQIKRIKGFRSIKLSISSGGKIQVTAGRSIPKKALEIFTKGHKSWIHAHLPNLNLSLEDGQRIGQIAGAPVVKFCKGLSPQFKFNKKTRMIEVPFPSRNQDLNSPLKLSASQKEDFEKELIKAFRQRAQEVLPARVELFARLYGFRFGKVSIRNSTSRWGSCSSQNNISLSLWICLLPEDLADYIILHELAHTKHKHHQAGFWNEVSKYVPDHKSLRLKLKSYQPGAWWKAP